MESRRRRPKRRAGARPAEERKGAPAAGAGPRRLNPISGPTPGRGPEPRDLFLAPARAEVPVSDTARTVIPDAAARAEGGVPPPVPPPEADAGVRAGLRRSRGRSGRRAGPPRASGPRSWGGPTSRPYGRSSDGRSGRLDPGIAEFRPDRAGLDDDDVDAEGRHLDAERTTLPGRASRRGTRRRAATQTS